jgi:thiamine pyrophosphate-dependent acetolactate synthase large subunit-like protein
VDLVNPDFEAFALSVGVRYALCEGEVEGRVREALRADGPTLLEVVVGDSAGIHVSRAKGLVRGAARRALGPDVVKWVKRALGRA